MALATAVMLSIANACNRAHTPSGAPFAASTMHRDLAYLASMELGGRQPGSPGAEKAYRFVEERFRGLGIMPGGDGGSYRQVFTDSHGRSSANVIGIIRGSDPAVVQETIVVGAHIDHFGKEGGVVRLGANDNASGVTTVLAIAHAVKRLPKAPRRSIAIMAFGSEELGCEGSHYYVEHSTDALSRKNVVYNINFDMVGTYTFTPRGHPTSGGGPARTGVDAQGTMPNTPGRQVMDSVVKDYPGFIVNLGVTGIDEDDSDYWPFCTSGIPFVGFFTDDPNCYHRSCDMEEEIDYENVARIAQIGSNLTVQLADSSIDLMEFKKRAKVSELGCK